MRILSFSAGMDVPAVNSLDYYCKKRWWFLYVRSNLFVPLGGGRCLIRCGLAEYPIPKGEIVRKALMSYHSVMLNVSEASPDSGNKWEILRLRSGWQYKMTAVNEFSDSLEGITNYWRKFQKDEIQKRNNKSFRAKQSDARGGKIQVLFFWLPVLSVICGLSKT